MSEIINLPTRNLVTRLRPSPSAWWRFLSSADTYDPARIDVDREQLRRFYLSRGYADVQVTSGVAELTRDRKDFVLTYTVFEGPRYNFGKLNVVLDSPKRRG